MKIRLKSLVVYLLLTMLPLIALHIGSEFFLQPLIGATRDFKIFNAIVRLLWVFVPFVVILVNVINTSRRYAIDEKFKDKIVQLQLGNTKIRVDTSNDEEHAYVATAFNHLIDYYQAQIDELKTLNYTLSQINERYQTINDYTKEIIFDWDFIKDEAEYSLTWWKKFGYDPILKNLSKELPKGDFVHPDDLSAFQKWIKTVYKNNINSKEEFRFYTSENNYYWVRIRTIPILNEKNEAIRLVGLIQDINDAKIKEDALLQRADYDYLSQVHNRSAFETKVENLIAQKEKFALLYIDIDDFRMFNTRFGHEFGDRVIQFIGSKIREVVSDIGFAGRVGGDEFLVCINEPTELNRVNIIAQKILNKLKSGLPIRESVEPIQVLCSMGIIFYPDSGTTLQELSSKADKAMYEVKNSGKNNFRFVG